MRKHWIWIVAVVLALLTCSAFAKNQFVVKHIHIVGAERVSEATIRSYMHIHEGQTVTVSQTQQIIKNLYQTGFFSNVVVARQGQALRVTVTERPTLSELRFVGNKAIKTKDLNKALTSLKLEPGDVYNPSSLNYLTQGLKQQYSHLGFHDVTIKTEVKPQPRHRVLVIVHVHEGSVLKVGKIIFEGNHAFSDRQLRHQMTLTTPGIMTIINHRDRYTEGRLNEDLEKLKNFYLNHGYLQYRAVSHAVTYYDQNRRVRIVIRVSEGAQYHISGYTIQGDPLGEKVALSALLDWKPGDVFSREKVIASNRTLSNNLADQGYVYASVSTIPTLNKKNHTVFLTYHIQPGTKYYVRHIEFYGNQHTSEQVLRREMRQMEADTYSRKNLEESKRRIANLPYMTNINLQTEKVTDTNNQVDVHMHVKEESAGKASVQGGWSDVEGFLYGANITEPNFLGTGNMVNIGFQRSQYSSYYGVSWTEPYYTINGVSRSVSLYYTQVKPDSDVNIETFTSDGYGATLVYGYPVSEHNRLSFGGGYDHISVGNLNSDSAPSWQQFEADNGDQFNQAKLLAGWNYNTLDRYPYPVSGSNQALSFEGGVPIFSNSLNYYTATYNGKWYLPLGKGFVFNLHTLLAYGGRYGDTVSYPFFKNFYGGGIETIPGYLSNSLGPKNSLTDDAALGGNLEMVYGANFIFPTVFHDKIRYGFTFDAGNIFQYPRQPNDNEANGIIDNEAVNIANLRLSAGVLVSWFSPLGPLELSLAFPLNKKEHDHSEIFQFTFGTSL